MKHIFSNFSISIAFQPKFLKRYLATNNAISNPQQKSEDVQNPIGVNMACEEVCMLENARQQVHTRAGFPGWKQKTCFVFVGHHLLPVNRSTSMPTIVLFQQLYNSINLSDINFLCTSSSGLWKNKPGICAIFAIVRTMVRAMFLTRVRTMVRTMRKKFVQCSYNALLKFVQYCTIFYWQRTKT